MKKAPFNLPGYNAHFLQALSCADLDEVSFADYQAQIIRSLITDAGIQHGHILDLGCGIGLVASFIKYFLPTFEIYGVDISAQAIDLAQQYWPAISFLTIEDRKLPFDSNFFDAVIVAHVLHHVPAEDHYKYIKELTRVIKPGGLLIILEPNPINYFTNRAFRNNSLEKDSHIISPYYLKKLLNHWGRTTIRFYYPSRFGGWFGFIPYAQLVPLGSLYSCLLQLPSSCPIMLISL